MINNQYEIICELKSYIFDLDLLDLLYELQK